MKLGTEKKGQVIALVALLVVAAGLLWRSFAGPGGAAPPPAPVAVALSPGAGEPLTRISQLDPRLHMEVLDQLRARTYAGDGRDLFSFGPTPAEMAASAAVNRAKADEAAETKAAARMTALAGPPPPPPIPLKFYGFAQAEGLPEKIFVQMGEDNYVVTQGTTIEHRYLIENISKVSVRVKDLSTNSEQELPLQQGQPTQP